VVSSCHRWHFSSRNVLVAAAKPWEKLEGCELIPNQWNDGDSFHVRWNGTECIFRLYFVDAPETDGSFAQRTADQAAYFGVTAERAKKIGEEAAQFTRQQLTGKKFVVLTRWRDALGRSKQQRFYALVLVDGKDLNGLLVNKGLARIHGTRVPLPDGRDSRVYLQRLSELEAWAKASALGGWTK
jgi:endonuclease YncB( thermonuclease family)